MVEELHVRNLALIEELSLEFDLGLNVITGETGAGKSMIVDALMLALGERGGMEWVREQAEKATVDAAFRLNDTQRQQAEALGIAVEEDGGLVLHREVTSSGRSTARANGIPVGLATLRQLQRHLVDFCGQHQQQRLLDPVEHVAFLDAFIGDEAAQERQRVRKYYEAIAETQAELQKLEEQSRQRERELDLIAYECAEIEHVAPQPGEDEALLEEREALRHVQERLLRFREAFVHLYEGENGLPTAYDELAAAAAALSTIGSFDPEAASWAQEANELAMRVEELAHSLRQHADQISSDPSRLAEVEERLASIERLKHKYGATIPDILAYAQARREEGERLQHLEDEAIALRKRCAHLLDDYRQADTVLSQLRHQAAPLFSAEVEKHLQALHMSNSRVTVAFEPIKRGLEIDHQIVSPSGSETIRFLLAANAGEPPRPLERVASGGELSRLILALKVTIHTMGEVDTLVFDEVDTGVAGRSGQALAEKLASLARHQQVLCVTHLPQIAAMGNLHISVAKIQSGGRTQTKAIHLEGSQRVEELARMLGGAKVTQLTRQSAQEMLTLAAGLRNG
ncbi:MAG: DNA repair protein RecN [Firmicutes bacterium]|nr:DNA repair protein RecN [Bacillota bacterium]